MAHFAGKFLTCESNQVCAGNHGDVGKNKFENMLILEGN
jgi:hypothetical protein